MYQTKYIGRQPHKENRMKRILSMVIIVMLMATTTVSATIETTSVGVPTLINISAPIFQVEQDGDTFTIIVSENASTGYAWSYVINDEALVEFVSEETVAPEEAMPGAPSEKRMTFKSIGKGVSTILFNNVRPFDQTDVAETFTVLAYKTDDKLIVEEDQMVYAMDTGVPTLYSLATTATYMGEDIASDVEVQMIDGKVMIPLRATLEAMGYQVTWNPETRGVEILKGAQWTAIYIGKNAYFRNRMAAHELSAAPVIVNSRTLVPVEFFADIIGKSITVDSQKVEFNDFEAVIHSGYVKSIMMDETGAKTLTLTSDLESDSIELQTIIHTNNVFTFFQADVAEGDYVNVVSSMVMTMSIPGQTSGYVVYK